MRLSKIIEILENKAIAFYKKNKDSIPRYILILFIVLYISRNGQAAAARRTKSRYDI